MPGPAWSQAPIFATLPPTQLRKLEEVALSKRLGQDEVLFWEDTPCTGFYVLVEGTIQLTRTSPASEAPSTLALVLPVNSFAEAAMFGGGAFPATATAIKPARVFHFPKTRFLGTMREDPDLALAIIHAQSVWLRRLTAQIESLSSQDSAGRLKGWLQTHLPPQGPMKLPMTKKALAAQLGMTPETLSRLLRALQEQGAIHVSGLNIQRLRCF